MTKLVAKMGLRGKVIAAACGVVAMAASTSYGALLVNFKPLPISPAQEELHWTGTQLQAGNGSVGNADGNLSPNTQTEGGLQIETPFEIGDGLVGPGLGKSVNTIAHSTTFYDVTMVLGGLSAAGGASAIGAGVSAQPYGAGTFQLLSTDPDAGGPGTSVVLLSGTITDGAIVGIAGSGAGAVLSSTVTYTGGAILQAATGGSSVSGSLSFSMLDIAPPFNTSSGTLAEFNANATGLFSAVPEPASAMFVALGAIGLGLRHRSKKA